jgi:hypothetical protein
MHRSAAAMEVGLFAPSAWPAATRDSLRILGPPSPPADRLHACVMNPRLMVPRPLVAASPEAA